MPERERHWYFDTVTLSNFALARRLDLLITRYGRSACVTQEVLDEITNGIVAGYTALADVERAAMDGSLGVAGSFSAAERGTYRGLLRTLAPGEASCIACAKHRGGTVATDDRAARECCSEWGVRFTGTIGILKASCRDGLLLPQDADIVLDAMAAAGYHSPVRRISDLV